MVLLMVKKLVLHERYRMLWLYMDSMYWQWADLFAHRVVAISVLRSHILHTVDAKGKVHKRYLLVHYAPLAEKAGQGGWEHVHYLGELA